MCRCKSIDKKIIILFFLALTLANSRNIISMQHKKSNLYSQDELNIFHCTLVPKVAPLVNFDKDHPYNRTIDRHSIKKLYKIIKSIQAQKDKKKYQDLYNEIRVELNRYRQLPPIESLIQKLTINCFKDAPKTVALCIRPEDMQKEQKNISKLEEIIKLESAKDILKNMIDVENIASTKEFEQKIAEAKYPELCLFSECDCIDRAKRAPFEKEIVKKVSYINQISYFGFGTGSLFPDLQILIRLIRKNKYIKIIHIADPEYKNAIQLLKEAKLLNTIIKNNKRYNICLEDIFKLQNNYHDQYAFARITTFALFIKLLSDFQNKPIELYIHKNSDEYITFCNKYKNTKANVATVMDYNTGLDPYINRVFKQGLRVGGLMGKLLKIDDTNIEKDIFTKSNTGVLSTPKKIIKN